ncbi:hypothetical protein GGI43DRAFT_315315 [Trichoderma evansii]
MFHQLISYSLEQNFMSRKSMFSLAEATAPSTAKKRQLFSGHGLLDVGVDSKRRRCEINDKVAKSSANSAAPAAALSSLKMSETLSARKQLSKEELCRGRRRWRAGSEPLDWDNSEWYLGNSMVASFEDRSEKFGSKSTTKVSTSAL